MNKLLKIKDERYTKVIHSLKTIIQGSAFEGKLYLCGPCVRDFIMGNYTPSLQVIVDLADGCKKLEKFLLKTKTSQIISRQNDAGQTFRFTLKEYNNIILTCTQVPRKDECGVEVTSIDGDAKLRPITIDALYYNISTDKILDPTGDGLKNLATHVIKSPLSEGLAFKIFPIHMIFIVRKAAEYRWGIEKNTWLSIVENARQIQKIATEDFTQELTEILKIDKPSIAILKMYYGGLLEYCFEEFDHMHSLSDNLTPDKTLLGHTLNVVDAVDKTDIIGRYAALFHDYGKMVINQTFATKERTSHISAQFAELALEELKLHPNVIKRVTNIINLVDFFDNVSDTVTPSTKLVKKFISRIGDDFASCLNVIQAENISRTVKKKPNQVKKILQKYEEILKEEEIKEKKAKLPINGNDLKNHFNLSSGEIIGQLLAQIQDKFDDNPTITKEECFNIAKNFLVNAYTV